MENIKKATVVDKLFFKEIENMSTNEMVEIMYGFTSKDENAELYLPAFGDGLTENENVYQKIVMNWNRKDLLGIIDEIYDTLEKIRQMIISVNYSDIVYIEEKKAKEILPADLFGLWKKYIGTKYDLSENYVSYFEAFYAKRLCKLFEIGAPEIITRNESNLFAQAYVINRYAAAHSFVRIV